MAGPEDHSEDTWFEGGGKPADAGAPSFDTESVRYLGSEVVGKGSMGRVLSVRDTFLGRRVAFKELRDRMRGGAPVSDEMKARFVREARITARLEHPGIVAVHDIGHTPEGGLYYTMRYVQGQTLAQALAATRSLADRLALLPRFTDACQAMAYAHDRSVVHRDLKPANIVLGAFGETVIVDWGLAKELDDDDADLTAQAAASSFGEATSTSHGSVLGTPAYMSPEQAKGLTAEADERSDVWSLGAILFEILAGRRLVPDDDPEAAVERVRTGALPDPGEAAPRAPNELLAICRRALARDPGARYADAAQLAHDLEAFQSGKLVRAYAYTPWERLVRTAQRYRTLIAVGLFAVVVVAAITAASFQRVLTERDRARDADARSQAQLAAALERSALTALEDGKTQEAEAFAAHALTIEERPRVRGVLAAVGAVVPPRLTHRWDRPCSGVAAVGERVYCADGDGLHRVDGTARLVVAGRASAVHAVGATVAAIVDGAVVVLRDEVEQFRVPLSEQPLNPSPWVLADGRVLVFDRANATLYAADGTRSWHETGGGDIAWGGVTGDTVFVVTSSRGVRTHRLDGPVDRRRPNLDDKGTYSGAALPGAVVVGTGSGQLIKLDPALTELGRLDLGAPVVRIAASPDGRWLAAGTEDAHVALVDAASLELVYRFRHHDASTPAVAFADGAVLTSGLGQPLQRFELTGLRPARYRGEEGVSDVAFAPDGSRWAAADGDGWVVVHDTATGRQLGRFSSGDGIATTLTWAGDTVVVGNVIAGLRRFDPVTGALVEVLHDDPQAWARSVEWTAEAGLVWVANDPVLRRHRGDGVEEVLARDEVTRLWELDLSPDGSHVLWSDAATHIAVATLPDLTPVWEADYEESPRAAALSPGGELLALATPEQQIRVVRLATGEVVAELHADFFTLDNLEFSPDGRLLAAASWDRRARVYSIPDGKLLATLEGHTHRVSDVEFSPDGRLLATASWDQSVRLWDLTDLRTDGATLVARVARDRGATVVDAEIALAPLGTGAGSR